MKSFFIIVEGSCCTSIRLDLYPLFSLSEHLVFATPAAAVLFLFLIGVYFGATLGHLKKTTPRSGADSHSKRLGCRGRFQGALMGSGVALTFYPGGWPWGAALVFLGLFLFFSEYVDTQVYFATGVFFLLAIWAFALGFTLALEGWPWSKRSQTISLNDGPPITGRVLAAGERGLLVFNALDGTTQLLGWREVRGIEAKVPLFSR